METCLLVKTQDKRKFLVNEKNFQSLMEYAKTFNVEIYNVEVMEGKIISQLKSLAMAICNPEYNPQIKVHLVEKVYPVSRPRQEILKVAKKIHSFIYTTLKNGLPVSLKTLKKKYKNHDVTDACLCNHLSTARKKLINEGHHIIKIGQGTYCLM